MHIFRKWIISKRPGKGGKKIERIMAWPQPARANKGGQKHQAEWTISSRGGYCCQWISADWGPPVFFELCFFADMIRFFTSPRVILPLALIATCLHRTDSSITHYRCSQNKIQNVPCKPLNHSNEGGPIENICCDSEVSLMDQADEEGSIHKSISFNRFLWYF